MYSFIIHYVVRWNNASSELSNIKYSFHPNCPFFTLKFLPFFFSVTLFNLMWNRWWNFHLFSGSNQCFGFHYVMIRENWKNVPIIWMNNDGNKLKSLIYGKCLASFVLCDKKQIMYFNLLEKFAYTSMMKLFLFLIPLCILLDKDGKNQPSLYSFVPHHWHHWSCCIVHTSATH